MMEQIVAWDKSLLLFLNGSDSLFLDGLFWTVTQTVTWIPLFLCVLYLVLHNNRLSEALTIIAFIALLVLLTDQTASGLCKPFFARLRPAHDPEIGPLVDTVRGYRGGLYGFISSHASNTFGAATFLSLLLRSRQATSVLFSWAVMTSYSRLYLGVHYPADILAGALTGVLIALVLFALLVYLRRTFFPSQGFYSSTYTPSGYAFSDISILFCVFSLTTFYIVLRALLHASAL